MALKHHQGVYTRGETYTSIGALGSAFEARIVNLTKVGDIDAVEVDPERLSVVERRLESIYDIARKHRCLPEQLAEQHSNLREELESLKGGTERIEALAAEMDELAARYKDSAGKLARKRKSAARKLEKGVVAILDTLAMGQCQFHIDLLKRESADPHPQGLEEVEFTISTNPGSAPQPAQPQQPGQDAGQPFVRDEKKVGRNEPCPCGSGRKFKQCHGKLN